jgi:hypothetical protein
LAELLSAQPALLVLMSDQECPVLQLCYLKELVGRHRLPPLAELSLDNLSYHHCPSRESVVLRRLRAALVAWLAELLEHVVEPLQAAV